MFASLKNKIREETGNEVTVKVNPKKGTLRGRHSRRGSTSSLNSIISTDGLREDQNTSPSSIRDDEDRQSFNMKKDPEYEKKIRDREKFLLMQFEEKDKHNVLLEREKEELETRVNELEEKLKIVEEQKNKLSHYRDDKEQLENLQAQEITKVKHLLLLRERELAERTSSLKESTEMVESLRALVTRLRHNEEELNCVQEYSGDQSKELRQRLVESELRADEASAETTKAVLNAEKERLLNEQLKTEINDLKQELEAERIKCNELCSSFDKERNEKDVTLLRNAQVSQEIDIARQRIASRDVELNEIQNRLSEINGSVNSKNLQLEQSQIEISELRHSILKLEQEVVEKDKNIKTLQQRLAIMKKTLQRELRGAETLVENNTTDSVSAAVLTPSSNKTKHIGPSTSTHSQADDEDINFKYLKHVIIKFLTSREYEAVHLIRAVATLLRFSPEEEKLLQDTLEWKRSWFGSRPKLGNGQLTKTLPPS